MFKEDASKGISLSQADRDKMSKLYEEISVQLEEMSKIMARTLGKEYKEYENQNADIFTMTDCQAKCDSSC
ncbi:hypothetical protein, partial [Paenibacillus sp. 1-18]|uniref:hypothetical protein n=1 Tax=Paenibacillus sp. 1-18 TaxID=1333846 RepID=UPI001E620440